MSEPEQVKGKVVKLKKNQAYESAKGTEYEAHLLVIEDADGDEHKFRISTKSKPADFVKKLEKGDKVTVKTGGKFNAVVAVYKGDRPSFNKFGGKGNSNPLGAIQGMVLKAAVDLANSAKKVDVDLTVEEIVEHANLILAAKLKVDKLVEKALKKDDDDDSDEDLEPDDAPDEEEAPKKKKHKVKDEDEDDIAY